MLHDQMIWAFQINLPSSSYETWITMVTSKNFFFCIPQGKPWSNSLIQKVFLTVKVRPSFDGLLNYIELYCKWPRLRKRDKKSEVFSNYFHVNSCKNVSCNLSKLSNKRDRAELSCYSVLKCLLYSQLPLSSKDSTINQTSPPPSHCNVKINRSVCIVPWTVTQFIKRKWTKNQKIGKYS